MGGSRFHRRTDICGSHWNHLLPVVDVLRLHGLVEDPVCLNQLGDGDYGGQGEFGGHVLRILVCGIWRTLEYRVVGRFCRSIQQYLLVQCEWILYGPKLWILVLALFGIFLWPSSLSGAYRFWGLLVQLVPPFSCD